MITIPLLNGQNAVELKYEIPYVREGMYISAAAAGVLLLDILFRLADSRKKRKKRKNRKNKKNRKQTGGRQ
jgi:hypothetical protein